jgi:hypothetical protein
MKGLFTMVRQGALWAEASVTESHPALAAFPVPWMRLYRIEPVPRTLCPDPRGSDTM